MSIHLAPLVLGDVIVIFIVVINYYNVTFVLSLRFALNPTLADCIETKRAFCLHLPNQDDKVHMRSFEAQNLSAISTSLKAINQNLSKGAKDADKVKKALMDFYNVLIKPISGLLGDMDPADKLVVAADEVLKILHLHLSVSILF